MYKKLDDGKLTIGLDGRIDSNNAAQFERELFAALDAAPDAAPVLDAENLAYISSAGLRVLMKLRKRVNAPVRMENASREVYEILEVTGFTELLDVRKAFRRISLDGLEAIGEGATAKVYRLDPETIVKVFHPNIRYDLMIGREIEKARSAFVSGVPTAIPYDVVKAGDCFGTVYELLDAKDLAGLLLNDAERRDDYIRKFAQTVREMHAITADPAKFEPLKAASLSALPALEGLVCSREEVEKLRRIYENIPDRRTFIHGDCHPGNAMVQDGKFMFIDLSNSGTGHPIFDMMSMCFMYHITGQDDLARQNYPILRGLDAAEAEHIWKRFLSAYLDTDDETLLQKAEEQIVAFVCARILFIALAMPGAMPKSALENYKSRALAYIDKGLEPLCF